MIPFYYGSDSRTIINYGSGSAKVRNKIMVPGQLKVTVPPVPVL